MTGILAVDLCVALSAIAGGGAVVVRLFRFLKRMSNVVDDWAGEPERPGVPGRPGVMTRLAAIEAELHPNHGTSLRDALTRCEIGISRLSDQFQEHLAEHLRRKERP